MADPVDPERETVAGFAELDSLLDHRVRLAVCVLLSAHETVSFSWLKQALGESDGNLGAHLRRLEETGYVAATKSFRGRRPVTWYRLTDTGHTLLKRHIENLRNLLGRASP